MSVIQLKLMLKEKWLNELVQSLRCKASWEGSSEAVGDKTKLFDTGFLAQVIYLLLGNPSTTPMIGVHHFKCFLQEVGDMPGKGMWLIGNVIRLSLTQRKSNMFCLQCSLMDHQKTHGTGVSMEDFGLTHG